MTFVLPVAFLIGGVPASVETSPTPDGLLGCLGLLLALSLLSILSYSVLRVRSFLKRSGQEKPDFTSLRSTGKTIVNAAPPDEDDPDQFGGAN